MWAHSLGCGQKQTMLQNNLKQKAIPQNWAQLSAEVERAGVALGWLSADRTELDALYILKEQVELDKYTARAGGIGCLAETSGIGLMFCRGEKIL